MTKICIKCDVEKDLSSFNENRNVCKSCRLLRRKEIYSSNIDAKKLILDRNKKYRLDNQESYRENRRNYEMNNKEAAKKRGEKFRSLNSEVIALKKKEDYIKNSEHIKEKVASWRVSNLPKKRATNARRRARFNNAAGANYTTDKHIKWKWDMYGGKCWICNIEAEATDHVIPLCAGGSHWPSNLRPICKSCNSKRRKSRPKIDDLKSGNAIVPQVAAAFISAFMDMSA